MCYSHPFDTTKVIKVEYNNSIQRNQNKLETYYYEKLIKKGVDFSHISKFYGNISTNLGAGIIYEAIKDFNGHYSKSFEYLILKKLLSSTDELSLLKELNLYLNVQGIVFGDVVLSNVLCQETSKDKYKLMIIDGLGARRFSFKFWLQNKSITFNKVRIKKQWKKLMTNYNRAMLR